MKPRLLIKWLLATFCLVAVFHTFRCRAEQASPAKWTELLVTNGQAFICRVTWDPDPKRCYSLRHEIGRATPQSVVSTNMNGVWFVMAAATNCYPTGQPIECRSMVANDSTNSFNLPDLTLYEGTVPYFGRLFVTNEQNVGLPLLPRPPLQPQRGSRRLNELRQGNAGVIQSFRLTEYFDLTSPGVYRVSFKGKLPSVTEVGQEVEFETPPLVIQIVATNSEASTEFPVKNR